MLRAKNLEVRRAAVLGAGVMGAQIAAHFANAGIPVVLFELAAEEGDANAMVKKAIGMLEKLKPPPLATTSQLRDITPANYRDDLSLLKHCDLVIEAIAERIDLKKSLYGKISPHIDGQAVLASNTSGLSITELAGTLPPALAERFAGVHFFNPPRYMHLVELIPHATTQTEVLTGLETVLTRELGKGVVYAKDTPNFIGNRIGGFSILSTMHHTERFELGFDTVDALTGPDIGRPKSATYRTVDVVGLDTMGHVIGTMTQQLLEDPWHSYFTVPKWLEGLVEHGALGQKTGAGIYRKQRNGIGVLDLSTGEYRPVDTTVSEEVLDMLRIQNPADRMAALRDSNHREAQFLWSIHRDLFHYCAYHLADIADSAREVDSAIRWGYGWKQGPFEIWQASGWSEIAQWIQEDIETGNSMANVSLPEWVLAPNRKSIHGPNGSFSPAKEANLPRSDLPVYRRQLVPVSLLDEPQARGTTIEETDDVRLWTFDDDVLILSLKTKMHTLGPGVIEGIQRGVQLADDDYKGLIIWQPTEPFSVGADLSGAAGLVQQGDVAGLGRLVQSLQGALMKLKYASVPTVAAVRGMALGGGCEIALQCSRIVAAHESYFGLVEAGVGLLPAGGGLKELATRAVDNTQAGDTFPLLQKLFEQVAMAKVSGSAREAVEMGYMRASDCVVMHPDEVLYVAHQQVRALQEAAYKPPSPQRRWPAAGRVAIANLKAGMVNMLEGHFISPHDFDIGSRIATVLCGGDVDSGSQITEDWLLGLEREHFITLAQNEKTQERIMHMLKTGKPLRN